MISPSAIAREGFGVPRPKGQTLTEPVTCMTCGVQTDAVIPKQFAKGTFTDWQYLASASGYLCPDCAVFMGNDGMRVTQLCVVNQHGAWSLAKDVHRAWFFLTPPEPPFVVMVADSQKQHLVWRAPVTLDRDLLQVQIGRDAYQIDRPLLLQAVEWCERAAELAREAGCKGVYRHPFAALDRKLKDGRHGIIRSDIEAAAADNAELSEVLDNLRTLGEGELWALAVLAKKTVIEPECAPIQFPDSTQENPA